MATFHASLFLTWSSSGVPACSFPYFAKMSLLNTACFFFLRILIISCFVKDTLELTGKGKHTNNQDGQTKKRHHEIDFFFFRVQFGTE